MSKSKKRAGVPPKMRAAVELLSYRLAIQSIQGLKTRYALIELCNSWRQLLAPASKERQQWALHSPQALRELWAAMGGIALRERHGGKLPARPVVLNDVFAKDITEPFIQDVLRAFDSVVDWCDANGTPRPAAVSKIGELILDALLATDPTLQSIEKICGTLEDNVSDKTVRQELKKLIDAGLAERPQGERTGATLTAKGKVLAEKLASRNDSTTSA